nr:ribosome maturation factor RimP [uncultured Stomatobaculum sp.]
MGKREGYVERTENFLAALQSEKAFEVVDVDYVREAGTWYLRILCDMPGGIGIEDCAEISRAVSAWLDREDFIPEEYILEVSSPGLSRSLKKEKDLVREQGKDVEVKLFKSKDGQKEFSGVLLGHTEDTLTIETEEGEKSFQRSEIAGIRLAPKF